MGTLRKLTPFGFIGAVLLGIALAGPPLARQIAFAVESGQQEAGIAALAELNKHDKMSVLFREVAKAVKPAVVVVNVKQKVAHEAMPMPQMDDFMRRFFGEDMPGRFRFRRQTPQQQQQPR